MIKTVCIYCASSQNIAKKYFEDTEKLVKLLVDKKIIIVFGGGATGLMGRIADKVIELNGEIVGIMPNFMKAIEWDHKGVYNFHFVEDIHARKKKIYRFFRYVIGFAGGEWNPGRIARGHYP